mgnify:CR=1 FL=1
MTVQVPVPAPDDAAAALTDVRRAAGVDQPAQPLGEGPGADPGGSRALRASVTADAGELGSQRVERVGSLSDRVRAERGVGGIGRPVADHRSPAVVGQAVEVVVASGRRPDALVAIAGHPSARSAPRTSTMSVS